VLLKEFGLTIENGTDQRRYSAARDQRRSMEIQEKREGKMRYKSVNRQYVTKSRTARNKNVYTPM
jgi:hypothetical protein